MIPLYHDWSTEKSWTSISPKLSFNRKTCNIFLKSRCISELSWNSLKITNAQVLLSFFFFFCQSSKYVSNEQPCLKTTVLYEDLLHLTSLFLFFYFIFRASISFSLFSNFSISSSFFLSFLMFFLKPLSSVVEQLIYTYIICIYILENLWSFA